MRKPYKNTKRGDLSELQARFRAMEARFAQLADQVREDRGMFDSQQATLDLFLIRLNSWGHGHFGMASSLNRASGVVFSVGWDKRVQLGPIGIDIELAALKLYATGSDGSGLPGDVYLDLSVMNGNTSQVTTADGSVVAVHGGIGGDIPLARWDGDGAGQQLASSSRWGAGDSLFTELGAGLNVEITQSYIEYLGRFSPVLIVTVVADDGSILPLSGADQVELMFFTPETARDIVATSIIARNIQDLKNAGALPPGLDLSRLSADLIESFSVHFGRNRFGAHGSQEWHNNDDTQIVNALARMRIAIEAGVSFDDYEYLSPADWDSFGGFVDDYYSGNFTPRTDNTHISYRGNGVFVVTQLVANQVPPSYVRTVVTQEGIVRYQHQVRAADGLLWSVPEDAFNWETGEWSNDTNQVEFAGEKYYGPNVDQSSIDLTLQAELDAIERNVQLAGAAARECFAANTPILMADGSTKPIAEIAVGDHVASFEGTGRLLASRVEAVFVNDASEFIELSDGTRVTPDHPYLCVDEKFRSVREVIDDGIKVVSADGSETSLTGRVVRPDDGESWKKYNFSVAETHTYVAGGIRVHNTSAWDLAPDGKLIAIHDAKGGGELWVFFDPLTGDKINYYHADTDNDGNTDLAIYVTADGTKKVIDLNLQAEEQAKLARYMQSGGEIGSLIGSMLGAYLAPSNKFFASVQSNLLSSVIGELGAYAGAGLAGAYRGDVSMFVEDAFLAVIPDGTMVRDAFGGAAIGTVSSFLTAELIDGLGLDGDVAGVFGAAAGSLLDSAITNVAANLEVLEGLPLLGEYFEELEVLSAGEALNAAGAAVASYVGTRLADQIIEPKNAFSSISSSFMASRAAYSAMSGAFTTSASVGAIMSAFAYATVAAFAAAVLWRLIGNLFGSSKPKIPSANAETVLSEVNGYFEVGHVTSANGGDEKLVRSMSQTSADAANSVIRLVTNQSEIVQHSSYQANHTFGHTAGDVWVKLGSGPKKFYESADLAVDEGAMWAIKSTRIVGGDLFLKRAIANTRSNGISEITSDLQIAEEFRFYKRNAAFIDQMIRQPYDDLASPYMNYEALVRSYPDLHSQYLSQVADGESDIAVFGAQYWSSTPYVPGVDIPEGRYNFENYVLSYSDLKATYGSYGGSLTMSEWGEAHWRNSGFSQGRTVGLGSNDYAAYVDHHADLTQAFAATTESKIVWGERHWRQTGRSAGRFMPLSATVDQDFYAAFRDRFAHVLAKDSIALVGETQTWYEENRAQVDLVLERLRPTQASAGWIITLQRAAELGLNRTSRSDFYGGFGGFTDSLRILSGQDFDNEDVHFDFDGTTLNVDYGRWNGRAEDNLMRGGDLSLGTDLIGDSYDSGGGASLAVERLDDGTTGLVFRDTAYGEWSNGTLWGSWNVLYGGDMDGGRHFKVDGGEYVNFSYESRQLGDSANRLYMYVGFYDAAGTRLEWKGIAGGGSTDWERKSKTVLAPTGTEYARVYMYSYARVANPGGPVPADIQVAARNIQFNRSATAFAETPDYTAPVYERFALEDFLADGGFNQMTGSLGGQPSLEVSNQLEQRARAQHPNLLFSEVTLISSSGQDNSSGNDIFLHTGSGGITIDDQHTETAMISYEYIVPGIGFETAGGWITDTFTITGGDDIFRGGSGNDTLYGRGGYDWLDGGDGNDVIYGGSEDDVILGGGGSDKLYGEDGDDYIAVGSGEDWTASGVQYGAWGGNGNDTLVASDDGRSNLRGDNGDDLFIATDISARSYFHGGAGVDTLSYERFTRGVTISYDIATINTSSVWRRVFADHQIYGVENLTGTNFDDDLTGDDLNNILRGLAGDDILRGGVGVDTLEGGAGADTLDGGGNGDYASYESSTSAVWIDFQNQEYFGGHAEGDTMISVNRAIGSDYADTFFDRSGWNTQFIGGRGDDWFVANRGSHNTDHFYGDEDFDTVDYADVASAVTINMLTNSHGGAAAGNRLFDIEQIVGSDFNDNLTLDAKDNYIQGGKGNDILRGGEGLDTYIYTFGDGRDTIYETEDGGGYDTLVLLGMNWADIHIYSTDGGGGRQGAFNIDMADGGQVSLYRNQYHWEDVEAGVDALDVGGVGSVDIGRLMAGAVGGNGNDTVYGDNTRADFIRGYAGNDTLYAAGSSTATETDGNLIWGGRGNDTLWASVGDDEYIFDIGDGFDTIRDSGGDDRIQFGPDVMADDVIYEVIGNDLYIGLRDYNDPDKTASQVDDRIRVVDGGTTNTAKRIEYLTAGGVDIDLAKLDINWTDTGGSGGGGSGGGGSGGGGGGFPPPDGDPFPPGGQLPPVVFDLDGDGLELVGLDESRVVFQSDSGGPLWRLGWVGADDGMLALDRDGSGIIDRTDEISFKDDFEGATTDLEGLRGFDSNGDGLFSAEDDQWADFRIWQDVNQNGIGSADELVSLEAAGLVAIDLTLQASGLDVDNVADSVYTNTADALMADGGVMTAYDVALRFGLARAVDAAAPDASVWAGFDPSAAGVLGIAYQGAEFSEAAIADLVRSWDVMSAGPDGASWIDLQLYQDVLDQLAAPAAPEADPNDPQTETFGVKPIVIDLAGDGLNLLNPAQSPIQMDANGDGALDRIGWVEHHDGMLALDRNGNGTIDGVAEISFVDDLAGAQTDLEGLRAYDSDGDGWLSAGDARFSEFRIWQDLNYDGVGSADELVTLDEAGLERLALDHLADTASAPGPLANEIFGEAEIVWAEGVEGGNAGDVELRAYRGFLEEQMIDEFQRLLAQERAVNGAFAFNTQARRAAMEEQRYETAAETTDKGSVLPGAMALNGSGFDPMATTAATGRQRSSASMSGDRRDLIETAIEHRARTAKSGVLAGLEGAGLSNAEFGSRWWTQGAQSGSGRAGAGSLAARLAELDRDRSAVAAAPSAGALPRSADALAEQQRLLQAIASFRGSSGVATLRSGDAVTQGQNDLFASRRALSRSADDFKQALYG